MIYDRKGCLCESFNGKKIENDCIPRETLTVTLKKKGSSCVISVSKKRGDANGVQKVFQKVAKSISLTLS